MVLTEKKTSILTLLLLWTMYPNNVLIYSIIFIHESFLGPCVFYDVIVDNKIDNHQNVISLLGKTKYISI